MCIRDRCEGEQAFRFNISGTLPGQIKGGGNGQQRTEYGQQGSDDDDFGAIQKISLIDIVLSMTLRAPDNGE